MNLSKFLIKYRGVIITKPENVISVSNILHSDPDICYMSGADVHKYDELNIMMFARRPDNPVVISFCWYCDEGIRLTCGSPISKEEEQYYIKDIELIEWVSKSVIILNESKEV